MFSGIITDIGTVEQAQNGRFAIACAYEPETIAIGASIACDGCCLTVTECTPRPGGGALFSVDVSHETLSCTTLGEWQPGRRVNLERALALGDELGGHLVTGHIDGLAQILTAEPDGASMRYRIACPDALAGFIAPKGSVALDGVSLTVNTVKGAEFTVNIIPHTQTATTWAQKAAGDRLNLEVDLIARYVARLLSVQPPGAPLPLSLSEETP